MRVNAWFPVQFFRLCRKRPWSTVDGEVLLQSLYTIASMRPWTLRMWRLDTPRCGGFGQRLCPDPRGTDGALGSGLPAIQDDPTTQRRRFAAQRAAEIASRCGEEAKRRTQLGKNTKDEQRPSGQASAGVECLGPKHTSKKGFAECDMISEAARFCRATRGHSSAYCDAECLGCPASLVVNRGRAGT